jgi:hypothetical protein
MAMNELMSQAKVARALARLTVTLIAVGQAACSDEIGDVAVERTAGALGNACGGVATISPLAASATIDGDPYTGDSAVAAGTQLPVRMMPWTHDGRFDEQLWSIGSRPGEAHVRDFKRGTTSRAVDRFPVSGNVQTTFTAAFQTRNDSVQGPFDYLTYTHLFGELVLDPPNPCADGLLRLEFTRNDPMLLEGLGW